MKQALYKTRTYKDDFEIHANRSKGHLLIIEIEITNHGNTLLYINNSKRVVPGQSVVIGRDGYYIDQMLKGNFSNEPWRPFGIRRGKQEENTAIIKDVDVSILESKESKECD